MTKPGCGCVLLSGHTSCNSSVSPNIFGLFLFELFLFGLFQSPIRFWTIHSASRRRRLDSACGACLAFEFFCIHDHSEDLPTCQEPSQNEHPLLTGTEKPPFGKDRMQVRGALRNFPCSVRITGSTAAGTVETKRKVNGNRRFKRDMQRFRRLGLSTSPMFAPAQENKTIYAYWQNGIAIGLPHNMLGPVSEKPCRQKDVDSLARFSVECHRVS